MVLLTQAPPSREEQRWVGHTAPPIPIEPAPQQNLADWGSLGAAAWLCGMAVNKIIGLFTQQQSEESKMFLEYMQAAERREQRAEAREERLYQLVLTLTQPKA